jgi:UDP-N-acetylmuramate dehydrogenase
MDIKENIGLSAYSTMRLGGRARYLAEAHSDQAIADLVAWAKEKKVSFLVIGQGSNIVWRDEGYPGLIIVNKLKGKRVLIEDDVGATVWLAAGESWDGVVAWAVENDWGGIESLSKIPGTIGAAPVQNIGAYGSELADVLVEVQAYDTQLDSFGSILKDACGFGYRTSRFKTTDRGRFLITGITMQLHKNQPKEPFYESLDEYFKKKGITGATREQVRQAVTAIRAVKLPDPSVIANNGSFFTNPIVSASVARKLKKKFPQIKSWSMKDSKVKLSAGWMVEHIGFKNFHDEETGMATWRGSALVIVNEQAVSTANLLAFKQKIIDKVQEVFGVTLEQEPELLP